jgi:hypothetical protein
MSDDVQSSPPPASEGSGKKRRRRRRRRRGGQGEGKVNTPKNPPEMVEVHRGGRRQFVEFTGPLTSVPASGRNPYKKRNSRPKRTKPSSAAARKRRLSSDQLEELSSYLEEMPEHLLSSLYRGLGGQPKRVPDQERMIQLVLRGLGQSKRLASTVKQLNERDRKALSALLQCGGIAHSVEFHRELILSYGHHENEWKRTMHTLANRGIVFAGPEQDGVFFYIIPPPFIEGLLIDLEEDLGVPTFEHEELRVMDEMPFCPPLEFSITSLAAYVDQTGTRLTQRHEIYRHDKEAMDIFFKQIWDTGSELFSFHLDFLMMHGMMELRGEYLSVNQDVMEEWLQLESEDQRDLMFLALNGRFEMSEWVLWTIHEATKGNEKGWVAERPLVSLYRRWKRGEDWCDRFTRGAYAATRTMERESYSFAPLVRAGILEMGTWGQEKFYRLSPRGKGLLEPPEDDGFLKFYLTPAFEIMAPAGLAPILLFRISELADLVGCDRANTYKITEISIERALERGWRRDDVLQFLRDNSQIGLPENVEQTLKGWIGHRGDVEFHDLMMLTVHRSQIRKFESNRKVKPYLLHRFAPGMYAVDRTRREEITAMLKECGFAHGPETRNYPGDPEQAEARQKLHRLVAEAREAITDPSRRGVVHSAPEKLHAVPGSKMAKGQDSALPPKVTATEVRTLIDQALSKDADIEMIYVTKTGQRMPVTVQPQRLAFKSDSPVLVGLDRAEDAARTYLLEQIERLRVIL